MVAKKTDKLDPTHASDRDLTEKDKLTKERNNDQMRGLGEPIDAAYTEGPDAEVPRDKPAETTVEHPLAPTDTNPNPHGQRDEPFVSVATKDEDGHVQRTEPEEDVEVEGIHDHGAHVGDGRVLHKGATMKVGKDAAKALVANKQAKRV